MNILKQLLSTDDLKKHKRLVEEINELEEEFKDKSTAELKKFTEELRERYDDGDGESLDELLPEAFAAVREAASRTLNMRHFDVQLIGGIVLHQGQVAEMRTGEGKTLVATLAAYLNAIPGTAVHIVTVNDYLARRDAAWMGAIYNYLGMTVSCIQSDNVSYEFTVDNEGQTGTDQTETTEEDGMLAISRAAAYQHDIVYGTNNEFGFDYLRDNTQVSLEKIVCKIGEDDLDARHFAIVDEVDNILIDEARTPLIISAPAPDTSSEYRRFVQIARRLREDEDFELDKKTRGVTITDLGVSKIERALNIKNLYAAENQTLSHYAENALRAEYLYRRDREYILREGQVVLVDEFTGRLTPGRRLAEGLHQAIEAKEGVTIKRGSMTVASVTLQNYFRLYEKLAGMTGTAETEAEEFYKIYKLDVKVIPTNKASTREDLPDMIFTTAKVKWRKVVEKVVELNKAGVPVLIGTTSIEKSENLTKMLRLKGIKANVLNARNHAHEAEIISQAGRLGSVTVSTNMAGRGTDIILGGKFDGDEAKRAEWEAEHQKVLELGGLFVLGTEKHETRRIDNQLRGRAGRQGDPGTTLFMLSMEDQLVANFGGDRIKSMLESLKWDENEPIDNGILRRAVESSQQRVEAHNFEIRKRLVEYDDVMNEQRNTIYTLRRRFLTPGEVREEIEDYLFEEIDAIVASSPNYHEGPDKAQALLRDIKLLLPDSSFVPSYEEIENLEPKQLKKLLDERVLKQYDAREKQQTPELMNRMVKAISLNVLTSAWVEHLTSMENMRQAIGLEAFGQRDPLIQYKREGFALFSNVIDAIHSNIARVAMRVVPQGSSPNGTVRRGATQARQAGTGVVQRGAPGGNTNKVGRNDPCPCGSGKKYKKCHGG